MDCKMAIRAAEVDPVGRKAYLSLKVREGGRGCDIGRIRNFLTKIRSKVL